MIPYVTFKDPRAAIALYEKALGATTKYVMDGPDGMVMHAELDISGSRFMLSSEWPGMAVAPSGRSPVNFMVYVDDVDATYAHAVATGMVAVAEPKDEFWGDRNARVSDGHGYEWTLAQHVEDVSEDEMARRVAAFAEGASN